MNAIDFHLKEESVFSNASLAGLELNLANNSAINLEQNLYS